MEATPHSFLNNVPIEYLGSFQFWEKAAIKLLAHG